MEEIRTAWRVLRDVAIHCPLLGLCAEEAPAEIFPKLENLQPAGCVKLRGVYRMAREPNSASRTKGVWTGSTAKTDQAVAWYARQMATKCMIVSPDLAPLTKVAPIKRLDGKVVSVSTADWFRILRDEEATRESRGCLSAR
jgi:threonine dehydratase